MKLGFHYHVPALQKDDQIWMPGFQSRFIDSLAIHAEKIICFLHTPTSSEMHLIDSSIKSKNVQLVDLGPHNSLPLRMLRAGKIKKIVAAYEKEIDLILLRGPSPLLPGIASIFDKEKLAFLIVGDNTEGIDDLPQPFWRKSLIRLFWMWNKEKQLEFTRKTLTFVNSQQRFDSLANQIPNIHLTKTTTLSQKDFFLREDTSNSPPYHLLYTGRIDRSKGLFEILEAMRILKDEGLEIIFNLVGWAEKKDLILEEMKLKAESFGLTNQMIYHGYKSVGPELFQYYERSDIFIVASKKSEGFPRTIWEAMAHSLPVVATRVGSIPDYIEESAVLVEPSSPAALAEGIKKIINDEVFRKKIIRTGRKLAKENTLENQSRKLFEELERWVHHNA